MELSVLCTWAFPLRGHLVVYTLSFRDSSIKFTMNIQAKGILQCQEKKKKKKMTAQKNVLQTVAGLEEGSLPYVQ